MRDREVQQGACYMARVGSRVVPVVVVGRSPFGRKWWVRNLVTGRLVPVGTGRLRRPALPEDLEALAQRPRRWQP